MSSWPGSRLEVAETAAWLTAEGDEGDAAPPDALPAAGPPQAVSAAIPADIDRSAILRTTDTASFVEALWLLLRFIS